MFLEWSFIASYTLCQLWQKGELWFFFKILHVRGRNTCLCKRELCFILLGGVFTSLLFYNFFFLAYCTLVLWLFLHILCLSLIYIYMMHVFFTYISMCCLFFFLYTNVSLLYAIFYFCFTLRYLNEFCLKCFRKTSCQNLSCHKLSYCKVFQEFMLGLDFIVLNKWL